MHKNALFSISSQDEYGFLRDEFLKRLEFKNQILALTLTIVSAFIGFGIDKNPIIALSLPPIVVFLALAWAQNEIRIRQISKYINTNYEVSGAYISWEKYKINMDKETRVLGIPLVLLSSVGIFLITQIVAVGIGVLNFKDSLMEILLLFVDIVSMIFVISIILKVNKHWRF